jgi:hypothetical protein
MTIVAAVLWFVIGVCCGVLLIAQPKTSNEQRLP